MKLSDILQLKYGFGKSGVNIAELVQADFVPNTKQIHSDIVHVLDKKTKRLLWEGDAFVTNQKNVCCFVRTADCVPILLCDPTRNAIAAVHAGWRGTAKKLVSKTVKTMCEVYGSKPSDIIAAIGPAICEQCYKVGPEVALQLGVQSTHLNLPAMNEVSLRACGVQWVERSNICTFEHKDYASYRRDQTSERQVSFILMRLNPKATNA